MARFNRIREQELLEILSLRRGQIEQEYPDQVLSWLQPMLGCTIQEVTVRRYLKRLDIKWKRRFHTHRSNESKSSRLDRIETTLNQILSLLQSR